MTAGMRRRALLAGATALPLFQPLAAAAQTADDGFLDACFRLAGGAAFPEILAAAARASLTGAFGADTVTALVRAVAVWDGAGALPDAVEAAARRLLVILYTGEPGTGGQRGDAPFYPWALAWQSLDFARAPGVCGGAFGSWSHA